MKNILKTLVASAYIRLAVTGIVAIPLVTTSIGCKSPEAAAYRTVASVHATVKTSLKAWADYVVAKRKYIATLPAVDQLAPNAELLVLEGRVEKALGDYKLAAAAAKVGIYSALDNNTAPATSAMVAAASAFVSIVDSGRFTSN